MIVTVTVLVRDELHNVEERRELSWANDAFSQVWCRDEAPLLIDRMIDRVEGKAAAAPVVKPCPRARRRVPHDPHEWTAGVYYPIGETDGYPAQCPGIIPDSYVTLRCQFTPCRSQVKLPVIDGGAEIAPAANWTFDSDNGWRCPLHPGDPA